MTTHIHKPTCLAPAHSIIHLTASLKLPCYAPFSPQPALSHTYPSCPIPLSDTHLACPNRPHTCVPISYGLIPPYTYPTHPTHPATGLHTVPQPAWHMPNYLTISHPTICSTVLHQPAQLHVHPHHMKLHLHVHIQPAQQEPLQAKCLTPSRPATGLLYLPYCLSTCLPTCLVPTRPSTCLAPYHNPLLKMCTCLASEYPLTHIPALLVTALLYTYLPLAKSLQLMPAASSNAATYLTASPQPIPPHSDVPHPNLPHYTFTRQPQPTL